MTGQVQHVIGIDPGPTPGIVRLSLQAGAIAGVDVVQCSESALWLVLRVLDPDQEALVAVERFVVRGRATADQSLTRSQAANLETFYTRRVVLRSASQVKPWATDRRLQQAVVDGEDTSLWLQTAGMRHARDAARHALFCAVHDAGVADPLSSKAAR